jgi:broad specificity phosphatase PhoE
MRLLWIRHGQMEIRASTVKDRRAVDRLFTQEEEHGLSPRGRREAELVLEHLADRSVDALYSSTLARARETGEICARGLGLPLESTPLIGELRVGHLIDESKSARWVSGVMNAPLRAEIKRAILGATLVPVYFSAWRRGRTVGGETPAELDARVRAFLSELEARHPRDATVALFAHGYLIFTLTHSLARSPLARLNLLRQPYLANGSITEMELESGELKLMRWAGTDHLRGL